MNGYVAGMQQSGSTDVADYVSRCSEDFQRTLLRQYCGVAAPVGGHHDRGWMAPHAGGGAIDIEYFGSPWIPLRGARPSIDTEGIFYADVPGDASGFPAKGAFMPRASIFLPCEEVWNRACQYALGHDSNAMCAFVAIKDSNARTTDESRTTEIVSGIWDLSDSVRKYFAQKDNPQVEADRKIVGPGMVIGDSTFHPDTKLITGMFYRATMLGMPPHSDPPLVRGQPAFGGSNYSGGIIGFNRVVVKKLHLARSTSTPYLVQWSVFTFGADLMHFDITHNNEGDRSGPPPRPRVLAVQAVVEGLPAEADGQGPWSSSK